MPPATEQEKTISDIEKVLNSRSTALQLKLPLVSLQPCGRLFGTKNLPKNSAQRDATEHREDSSENGGIGNVE